MRSHTESSIRYAISYAAILPLYYFWRWHSHGVRWIASSYWRGPKGSSFLVNHCQLRQGQQDQIGWKRLLPAEVQRTASKASFLPQSQSSPASARTRLQHGKPLIHWCSASRVPLGQSNSRWQRKGFCSCLNVGSWHWKGSCKVVHLQRSGILYQSAGRPYILQSIQLQKGQSSQTKNHID